MSTRQPGNPSLLGVEKPFLFSDLAVKAAKSENKKGLSASKSENKKAFQRQRRLGLAVG